MEKIKEEAGVIELDSRSGSLNELIHSITSAILKGATGYKVEFLEDDFDEWYELKLFKYRELNEEEKLAREIRKQENALKDLKMRKIILKGRKLHGH